jgi:hypothetical protein
LPQRIECSPTRRFVQAASAGKSLQAANEKFLDLVRKSESAGKEEGRFEARLTQTDKNFVNLLENFFEDQRKDKPDESRQILSVDPYTNRNRQRRRWIMLGRDSGHNSLATDANLGVMDHGVKVSRGAQNAIGGP